MVSSKLAGSLRRLVGVGCLVALLAACSPSMEDVVAEHRPAVEAVFGKLKSLAGPALNAPPVAEDGFELGGKPVVLDGDASNALFIVALDLGTPETASSTGTGATRASGVETCGDALTGEFHGIPKGAELFLSECARAEYVFVLRTFTDQPARIVGSDSFEPGLFAGDVLLYRLADGALLGGFRVEAQSSDQVQVELDSAGNPIDPIARLNSDMTSRVFVQIDEKLRALVPGSIPAA
jgi:hypothetical protein